MSVMAGLLDPETAKHTAQYHGAKASIETLKRKVMEFSLAISSDDKMDLGRVQQKTKPREDGEEEKEDDDG